MHKGFKITAVLGFLAAIGLGLMESVAQNDVRWDSSGMRFGSHPPYAKLAIVAVVLALLVLVVGWLFQRFLKTVPQRLFFLWILGTLVLGTICRQTPDIFGAYLAFGGYLLIVGALLRAVWLMLNSVFGDSLEKALRIAVLGCAISGAGSWVSLAALVVIIVWIPVRRFYFEAPVSLNTEN